MRLQINLERRADGRWVAVTPQFPTLRVFGEDRLQAFRRAEACVLRLIAERLERGESIPGAPPELAVSFSVA